MKRTHSTLLLKAGFIAALLFPVSVKSFATTPQDDKPCMWRYDGCENGHFGVVDEDGNLVSGCNWKYVAIVDSEGLIAVQADNGKWGFLNISGKLVIPCTWKFACDFCEGLSAVRNDKDKIGFIDKTGKLVIPCEFDGTISGFKNGRCRVKIGNWYYDIDRKGKVIE